MTTNAALNNIKTVADANAAYDSMRATWRRSRAVCNGEQTVKDFDNVLDVTSFTNMLIPFSGSMTQRQYNFFKAEAELPGVTAQFGRMLVNGLLRKKPSIEFADASVPPDVTDWILNEFGKDDSSLTSFLSDILWEEVQISRAWIIVDYPRIDNPAQYTTQELQQNYKPYPVWYKGENVINWRVEDLPDGGRELTLLVIKGTMEKKDPLSEFHPMLVNTVWVHEIVDGLYQMRIYQEAAQATNIPVVAGQQQTTPNSGSKYELTDTITDFLMNGERMDFIPAWPANGSIDITIPMMQSFVDKEVAIYNKISRRNHLLYGAATYTPIVRSDMTDEAFDKIVNAGLGSWLKIGKDDNATVLETPTAALADMDRAIAAGFEELARLGIRVLAPDNAASGVALEIRNASQTVQLSALSNRVTATMKQVIAFMINWRYGTELDPDDIKLILSNDLASTALGADWMRLATEWYQQGLIPRSAWLVMVKANEMLPADYDDEKGKEEITADADALNTGTDYTSKIGQGE